MYVRCRGAVKTATELIAMEEIMEDMVTKEGGGPPLCVCWEIVRLVLNKDVLGSKSYVAPEDGEEVDVRPLPWVLGPGGGLIPGAEISLVTIRQNAH